MMQENRLIGTTRSTCDLIPHVVFEVEITQLD